MVETFRQIPEKQQYPELIQAGMGVAVSTWELAKAVAIAGERLDKWVLGVVSGTAISIIMAERLQRGDPSTIRALKAFPVPEIAQEILDEYPPSKFKHKLPQRPETLVTGSDAEKAKVAKLIIVANFVEVWLAKEGHNSPIGINLLEKIQLTHLYELYGAMLAGVDYVLMGAGIPNQIPGVLDRLTNNEPASYKLDVIGSKEKYAISFDPATLIPEKNRKELKRPKFFAIVSHDALAMRLASSATGEVNGFVVEGPTAGGHNAPARGKEINEKGEPIYTKKDDPDLGRIRKIGKPFWLAGGWANSKKLKEAQELGATGVQVGSVFALCKESGLPENVKSRLKKGIIGGDLFVRNSSIASPSGYPFQVVQLEETLSNPDVYEKRERNCRFGYLVQAYKKTDGSLGFRCPAEPIKAYLQKGGEPKDTEGKVCLCTGLASTVGYGPAIPKGKEPEIITLGKDLSFIEEINLDQYGNYSVEDVINFILQPNSIGE